MFFLAMLLAGWAIYERFNQTNDRRRNQSAINKRLEKSDAAIRRVTKELKKVTFANRKALRDLLCLSLESTLSSPDLTATQKAHALDFYDRALVKIEVPPCSQDEGR